MKAYQEMNRGELTAERAALQQEFDGYKAKGLKLNMARGASRRRPACPFDADARRAQFRVRLQG